MSKLTEKELSAIEDSLSAEQVVIKKYQTYAMLCNDPQLKSRCEEIAKKHQRHYDRLMSYLN